MILGSNGSGKTTLMNVISEQTSFRGKISLCGEKLKREDVSMCMQENIFFEFLTVKENLEIFAKMRF